MALREYLCNRVFSPWCGWTLSDWRRLMERHRREVHPAFWPRAAVSTALAAGASLARRWEDRRYADPLARVEVAPPIFLLGHWRSGTTWLHQLLACDARFRAPSFAETLQPHTMLLGTPFLEKLLDAVLPSDRVIDKVALAGNTPAEDEFALAALTGGLSPYLAWAFPSHGTRYERYLDFHDVAADEVTRWKSALRSFTAKLTLRHGKPLILKSPPHTARIRLLLEVFPHARFVHLHRHPLRVYQSTKRLVEIGVASLRLAPLDRTDLTRGILRRYQAMYDAFFAEQPLVPRDRWHELRFADLERDPVAALAGLYASLQLGDFTEVAPVLRRRLAALAGYRKSAPPPLDADEQRQVVSAWSRNFAAWNYALDDIAERAA